MNNNQMLAVVGMLGMVCAFMLGLGMGRLIEIRHYEDVITKLELQFQMSIDR